MRKLIARLFLVVSTFFAFLSDKTEGRIGNYRYDSETLRLLGKQGKKIVWIREFRNHTKIGLKECKEEYERRFEHSRKPRTPVFLHPSGYYYPEKVD